MLDKERKIYCLEKPTNTSTSKRSTGSIEPTLHSRLLENSQPHIRSSRRHTYPRIPSYTPPNPYPLFNSSISKQPLQETYFANPNIADYKLAPPLLHLLLAMPPPSAPTSFASSLPYLLLATPKPDPILHTPLATPLSYLLATPNSRLYTTLPLLPLPYLLLTQPPSYTPHSPCNSSILSSCNSKSRSYTPHSPCYSSILSSGNSEPRSNTLHSPCNSSILSSSSSEPRSYIPPPPCTSSISPPVHHPPLACSTLSSCNS